MFPSCWMYFTTNVRTRADRSKDAISSADHTWEKDRMGVLMIDYSNQEPNFRKGKHANTLDVMKFKNFLSFTIDHSYDLMLEIKDKEKSVAKASTNPRPIINFGFKLGRQRKKFSCRNTLGLFVS